MFGSCRSRAEWNRRRRSTNITIWEYFNTHLYKSSANCFHICYFTGVHSYLFPDSFPPPTFSAVAIYQGCCKYSLFSVPVLPQSFLGFSLHCHADDSQVCVFSLSLNPQALIQYFQLSDIYPLVPLVLHTVLNQTHDNFLQDPFLLFNHGIIILPVASFGNFGIFFPLPPLAAQSLGALPWPISRSL